VHRAWFALDRALTTLPGWYRDLPAEVLSTFFTSADAHREAWLYLDRIALLSGKTSAWCRKTSEIAEIQDRADAPPASREGIDEEDVRRQGWRELVHHLERLEREHGWGQVDGTKAYTQDGKDIGDVKSSMLLGEGHRTF
jgi:hypothetical protein